MRVFLWIGFALWIPTAESVAAPALKPPPPKAQPSVVGTWVCDGITSGGTAQPAPDLVYEFTADGTLRVRMYGEPAPDQQYRTDTTAQPAEIDWLTAHNKVLMPGVFKVEGDRLTICWNDAGQGRRPAALQSPPKTTTLLQTFKRVPPK